MGGINVGRWLAGGVAAGLFIWVIEGVASVAYMSEMEAALAAANLSMAVTPGMITLTVMVSLIAGLTLVFFYAAARPRFGPGPATAAKVAVALWFGGYLLSLSGLGMIGLYPIRMLLMWGTVGLVEMILAAILGAWIYREEAAP